MILGIDCREFVVGRVTGIGRFLRGLLEEIARSRPRLMIVTLAGPGTRLLPGGPCLPGLPVCQRRGLCRRFVPLPPGSSTPPRNVQIRTSFRTTDRWAGRPGAVQEALET